MKKTKAIFAVVVILAVAGASAGAWYLNSKGVIGGAADTSGAAYNGADSFVDENQNGAKQEAAQGNGGDEEGGEEKPGSSLSQENTTASVDAAQEKHTDVNEFLSVFSRVYFAENGGYSANSRSVYEMLRFAFSHIRRTDNSAVVTMQKEDSVGSYMGVSFESVNEVLSEYLGMTVSRESVYTENDYAFFLYENGYFYTPAADGIGYTNLIVADSVQEKDGMLTVSFTVYSGGVRCDMTADEAHAAGEPYASGSAQIERSEDGFLLTAYRLND